MATLMDSAAYLSLMPYKQGPNSWENSILKFMDRLEAMPVGADHISDWTASDPVLQQVQTKVQHGWCDKCPSKGLAALLCDKRQTELTKWVHIVGKLCGHASKRSTTAAGELAYCSSRNCEDLESCT